MSQLVDELPEMQDIATAANPFPGLRPFKIEESHLFFGREGQSDEVLLKLSKERFVAVIGPSGSGKSSFIYCGVMPILYGGFLTDSSPDWEVVVTRPGAGPIDNLAEALLKTQTDYNSADLEDKKIKRTIVSTLLQSSSLGLVEAIEQSRRSADVNYLVLVDQFEELFRFKDSKDANAVNETLAFVNLLIEAINYTDAPIYVAITMRSDFIGDCAQFPELTAKINDSHYLIPQMTRDQKRTAIEGPVAVGDANISQRLVQQLLNDLGDNPDQLPILQHALMRTWNYWTHYKDAPDEPVDLKHYEAIGTMAEALSQHANEAYDELTDEQKHICEVLFKAITEKRGDTFGIRRPTRLNEIAAIADVSENEVIAVVEKFREPGRSLVTPAHGIPLGSRSMIDISHESLMRIWVRLKNWVDDEAEAVQMYTRLAEAATQYQVGKAGLWRPPDLQLALNWQAKHKPTLVWGQRYHPAFERTIIFLEYSKKEFETEQRTKEMLARRRLRNAKITALVLGGFLILAIGAMVFAFEQRTRAQENEDEAKKNAKEALVQRDSATLAKGIAEAQTKIAKEQTKIAEDAKNQALVNLNEANTQRALAIQQSALARKNELLAIENADRANVQTEIAKKKEQEANIARENTLRLRYLAIAKAMAVTSRELNDKTQQALYAQQAFNFNSKYQGSEYSSEIYNGLFAALKKWEDPLTRSLSSHTNAARALVTSVKDNVIFSGGSDGKVVEWKQSGGIWAPTDIVGLRSDYQVYAIDVSPDGRYLAVGGLYSPDRAHNYVELYDLTAKEKAPKKIVGYNSDIENICFAPDSKGFFARTNSGFSIVFSDLNTAQEVIKSKEKITSLDLNDDGSKLAGVGSNGNLYVWDVKNSFSASSYSIFPNGKDISLTVAFMPKSNEVAIGDESGEVRLVTNGIVRRTLSGHSSQIEQIKFSHSGQFMATASKDKTIRIWNIKKLNEGALVLGDHDWVWNMAFSPDDTQLMAGIHAIRENIKDVDYTIHVWPIKISTMSGLLCGKLTRNMTPEEWKVAVAEDLDREKTCESLPLSAGN